MLMRENRLLTFVIILIVLVVYAACRKTDMPKEKETKVDVKQIQHKFYYSHPAADPHIKALVGFLQRKNSSSDFIEKTIQRVGLPVWNKAQIYRNGNLAGRGQEDSVTYTYIPFSRENENFVNASLVIQTTPTDTTTSWICDWQYNYYDFNPPTGSSLTAIQVFIFFAKQDNHVFGRRQFSITDNRLLNCLAGMTVDTSKNYVIELDSVDGAARPESMGVPDPTCIVVMEYQQLHYTVTYHMIGDWCIIDEITWGNIPPPGNGGSGGSGGGGGTPPPPECEPPVANRGMNAQPPGTGCPPGWNVPPPIVPPTPSEDSLIALYLKYISK